MMTPGTYIAKRRQAAGLSIDDVAAMVSTSPRLGVIDRRAWIERIEQDVASISYDVAATLADAFPLSLHVLKQLIDLRSFGQCSGPEPSLCIHCGCSDRDPCIDPETHAACGWAAGDICTSCTGKDSSHAA
ncbi:transcriptional regulator with XRE-family HTH domain [Sphingobium wenxiniae]|nr:helix-turn-helix transcriptional regulator [Sphingobium wenxiniae]MBB6191168.1 transcriptional regulator with XRE-family HTH domain [Sphingobium wenxiniae]